MYDIAEKDLVADSFVIYNTKLYRANPVSQCFPRHIHNSDILGDMWICHEEISSRAHVVRRAVIGSEYDRVGTTGEVRRKITRSGGICC